jgi:ornithine carbamoyltransferase
MTKDLTSINDLSKAELLGLLDLATDLKKQLATKPRIDSAPGTVAALIFEKPSLRTRVTFEVAMRNLGGSAVYLGPSDIGMGKRETVEDVAKNLSRWIDCIVARVFAHQTIVELAQYASVPVVNALCDLEHPCQILADLLTVKDHRGSVEGATIAWTGDGNNVCNSLMLACTLVGAHVRVATPKGFEPPVAVFAKSKEYAAKSGAQLLLTNDPVEAACGADFIYTDVWASMGQENEAAQRAQIFRPFQLNKALLDVAAKGAKVLHCLPAHRGEEISAEVLDGPSSVVLDQAENRLHAQRALLHRLLGN